MRRRLTRIGSSIKIVAAFAMHALLCVLFTGCCGKADPPCAGWAKANASYSAELLAPYTLGSFSNRSYDTPPLSCTGILPPDDGQTVSFTTGDLTRKSGGSEACRCIPRFATFDVAGFEELSSVMPSFSPGVIYSAFVRLPQGCEGMLTLAIGPLDPSSMDAGDPNQEFALFRRFEVLTNTGSECEQAGISADDLECADAWLVAIRDANGEQQIPD